MNPLQSPTMVPRLSVVIPVYNSAGDLDRCLASLRLSDLKEYESIVVDDGSSDASAAVAARHGATVYRLETRGGPARARNHGAARAAAEIVAFFDADVCVHIDTLTRMLAHLQTHAETQAVMGSYDDSPADPHFVAQYKNLLHHFVHQTSRTDAWTFWTGCGAVRRAAFLEIGGFDESFARPSIEDIEMGARMHARGWRLDLDPTIQVKHLKRWTLRSLIRTDVRDRAIPWLLLMLRERSMPADLNVTFRHRISVVLAALLAILLTTSVVFRSAAGGLLLLASLSAGALLFLNQGLYRFFARKRGTWFALRAIPLHWLYYLYCGLSVGVALAIHVLQRARGVLSPASPGVA